MSEAPKYWYVVGTIAETEHLVFVVHEATPDIFRRVATFTNKVRAEDYADMENDFRPGATTGAGLEQLLQGREGDDQPAAAHVAEPRSALSVRRTTVVETTRTRIAHQEVEESEPEQGQVWALPKPRLPGDSPAAPPPPASEPGENLNTMPLALPVHADQIGKPGFVANPNLRPLTPNEAKVFEALRYFTKLQRRPTALVIVERAGVAKGSITTLLVSLERKGYIRNVGVHMAPDYRVIAEGEPQVDMPRQGGNRDRGPSGPSAPALPRKEPGPVSSIEPQSEPADSAIYADDLSARQRSALICVSKDDLSDRMLALAGIGTHELSKILLRLREHGLVGMGVGGKWHLTPAGERIAEEIKTKKGPGPLEVKVSMPVVRQEKPKDVPLKRDPAARDAIERFTEANGVRKFPEADSAASFNIAEYLRKKGHHVADSGPHRSAWMIDGKRTEWDAVVALVNRHRVEAELPPLTF